MRCGLTGYTFNDRSVPSRFIRSAGRGLLAMVGLVLVLSDGRGTGAAPADPPSIFAVVRKAIAEGNVAQTEQVGFGIGRPFRETPSEGAVLTGFHMGLGKSNQVQAVFTFQAI